ncbi:MAG: hypothetical protein WCQ57_05820 [Verrucomicrobiota bacterium]
MKKHRYTFKEKQDLWDKGRYSSKRRDRGIVIVLLIVGVPILVALLLLLLKS